MPVTIQQIAERVGVSKQAVSYALNDKEGQVSAATREKILKTAKRLGYQPNFRARSFARKRSQTIGLVYGRPADYVERSRIVSALVERLADLDHELMLIPAMGPVQQWAHKLRDGRIDGCLVTHPMPIGLDHFIAEHSVPAVFLNLRSNLDVPQVYFDDAAGCRLATGHLLELGHRRITYFSSPKHHGRHYSDHERRDAFVATMTDAGLAGSVETVIDEYDDFARDLAVRSADDRPTALVVYNDHDAIKLTRSLERHGLNVPGDLSLVSFSEDDSVLDSYPPLTAVTTPAKRLAEASLGLLMRRLASPNTPTSAPVVLDESLLIRDSTRSLANPCV